MDAADKFARRSERLRLSQKQVADRVGMTQQSYEAIEAGRTQRSKFLPRIAQVLGLPMSELDPGLVDTMRLPDFTPARQFRLGGARFPVYTAAEGGPARSSARPIRSIGAAPRAGSRASRMPMASISWANRWAPEFEPGDVALVNPALPLIGNTTCIFYAELHGEARATIKRLRRASTRAGWCGNGIRPTGRSRISPQPA